jgi:hypothetical protein
MWPAKRAIVDGWDVNRALEEATALGLNNETLKQFFLAQIKQRKVDRLRPAVGRPATDFDFQNSESTRSVRLALSVRDTDARAQRVVTSRTRAGGHRRMRLTHRAAPSVTGSSRSRASSRA